MTELRDHLRQAVGEYHAVRYPDDLAGQVLHRPRRWLWRMAVIGSGLSGLAAALALVVMLQRATQPPSGSIAGFSAPQLVPVPPPLPAGIALVPPSMSVVPPPLGSIGSLSALAAYTPQANAINRKHQQEPT
jgi:hypothetical protein